MALVFGLRAAPSPEQRKRLLEQLRAHGYAAKPAFPGVRRAALAPIYVVDDRTARDIDALRAEIESVLPGALDYIEVAPARRLKER
jgi:hypothetical protein